jgi:hypothetical protein
MEWRLYRRCHPATCASLRLVRPEDEPALKRAASAESIAAQNLFLRLNLTQLALLSASALLSGWHPLDPDCQRGVAIGVFVLMVVALAVALALRIGRFDDKWFQCRAIAENVKSAMWYFIMRDSGLPNSGEARYTEQLREVEDRFPELKKALVVRRGFEPDVTQWMRETQQLGLQSKLSIYRDLRLNDQMRWYQSRAKLNAEYESRLQWMIFVLEFIAILYAALQAWQLLPFNAIGFIAAISAALVAWNQTKRYSDLANSYSVATEDLRRIAAASSGDLDIVGTGRFVRDVETAISREHSIWLTRRAV